MKPRAARLLDLLDALRRQRRPVSGAALAQALGVSLRTLYRDIATLRQQGADIAGDPGVGYALRPGFLLPPLMFGADELEALVLGMRWVGTQADAELARAADAALARIGATLPAELRLAVETSGLFVPRPRDAAAPEPWLPALRHAIRDERALRLDYADAAGASSTRIVWPFAMAFFGPSTRVFAAWCELRRDFRHFRADRVRTLEDTGQRYPVRRHALIRRWRAQMQEKAASRPS
ncbi:helix-turn-helix transcriptional regulator [Piscinibacter sp.]|uniref:helix-turn-helix transcriptional regulator n=1 Tax=Piscinibacter sp. TaxID=1903157 RepID=UPI0039E631E2